MAAVMAIIIDNLQLKFRNICAGWILWGLAYYSATKKIFSIKIIYNDATKTDISNFQKI